jgi:DNA-binding transcriptional LysR family regulator
MSFFLSKKIRYFVTVMDARSLSQAADKLHITRSPLGKAIAELESTVGEKLFMRKGNYLEPTEVANFIYNRLKPIYESLLSLEENFSATRKGDHLRLYIDKCFPKNIFDILVGLHFNHKYSIRVERRAFSEETILELYNDPQAAFLTLRESDILDLHGYASIKCNSRKTYLIYANNQKNQHKTVKDILSIYPVIKDTFICDGLYLNFLKKYVADTEKPPQLINENLSFTSMLNLVTNNEAVACISDAFLKFCSSNIAYIPIDNFVITPRVLCRESQTSRFDYVVKAINAV